MHDSPAGGKIMNVVNIHLALKSQREHICPHCKKVAKLITDLDEQEPYRNKEGNLQYYCPSCNTRFSVDQHDHTAIIQ
jgi:uncharacterized Zn-finger protein